MSEGGFHELCMSGHVWHCSCACAGASHVVWHELGCEWLLGWCSGPGGATKATILSCLESGTVLTSESGSVTTSSSAEEDLEAGRERNELKLEK